MTSSAAGQRRFSPWKLGAITAAASVYLKLAMRTSRIRFEGLEHEEAAREGGRPIIYSFWHDGILFPVYTHRGKDIHVLSSLSRDGDLIARFTARFGYRTIRGSSSRGGARALVAMRKVVAEGYDTAFTPDGPRGPRHTVQLGVIALARLCDLAIVPAGFASSRCVVLEKSWDKFRVPLPFGRVAYAIQPPLRVERDASEEEAGERLAERLHAADLRAREMLETW